MSELLKIACCCGANLVWQANRCPTIADESAPPIVYILASQDIVKLGFVVFLTDEYRGQCYSVDTTQAGIPIGDVPPNLVVTYSATVGSNCSVCELPPCLECEPCGSVLSWTANVSVETHHFDGKITVWQWTAFGTVNRYASIGQPDPKSCSWSPLKQGGPQYLPWSGTCGIFTQSAQGAVYQTSCSVTNEVTYSVAGGLECAPFVQGDPFYPPSLSTETMWITRCDPNPLSKCSDEFHPCVGVCFAGQKGIRVVFPREPGCFSGGTPAWATTINPTTNASECWSPVIAGTAVCELPFDGTITYITPELNWT